MKDELRRAMTDGGMSPSDFDSCLRLLATTRAQAIAQDLLTHFGPIVQAGPFRGMRYSRRASEGGLAPRLLGSYERELHPIIEKWIGSGPDTIAVLGAGEGYYAVGFLTRLPTTVVYAFDSDPVARELCSNVANENEVSDRLRICGEFKLSALEEIPGSELVILCDIEGAELGLLDCRSSPRLRNSRIIVECHRTSAGNVQTSAEVLVARFSPTHHVCKILQAIPPADIPARLQESYNHISLMLALWEWRSTPGLWLVMEPKS